MCPPNIALVWAYDPTQDKFKRPLVWSDDCLEDMQFMTNGPLTGDVIMTVDNPTKKFPWPWGVEVYKFIPPDHYVKILDFIGKAVQAGNTPPKGDVISIDMPEILQRLHVSN